MGLGLALRAFMASFGNQETAKRIQQALDGDLEPRLEQKVEREPKTERVAPEKASSVPAPTRSDAITLLSALQRESRLVDLIFEDLTHFADEQVGAAARPCLLQSRETLTRLLSVQPLLDDEEGATVDIGSQPSPTRYQQIGDGHGSSSKLIHHGWIAKQVSLPKWDGVPQDAEVIAPAQVES